MLFRSLDLPPGCAAKTGQKVTLGLRPEHLQLGPQGGSDGVACKVSQIEFTGADTLLGCTPEDARDDRLSAAPLQVLVHDLQAQSSLRTGDSVQLSIAAQRMQVFDAASGLRL